MASSTKEGRETVNDFLNFLNVSHTAFHAVEEVGRRFEEKRFREIERTRELEDRSEENIFSPENGSTIVAFAVGEKYEL